jgi:hypothetical protein
VIPIGYLPITTSRTDCDNAQGAPIMDRDRIAIVARRR